MNALRSLSRASSVRLEETRIEISSFNENEEFEIRDLRAPFAGHVHRGCRHRRRPSALSRLDTPITSLRDRKPAPNALGRRHRTAERSEPGCRLSFHDLNERKSARARERGEPVVAGRAVRSVRVVTRLWFYRNVLERPAASKSRARKPLRRVLGPPHHHRAAARAVCLFPVSYTHLTLPTILRV